jgi:hypothetical protein
MEGSELVGEGVGSEVRNLCQEAQSSYRIGLRRLGFGEADERVDPIRKRGAVVAQREASGWWRDSAQRRDCLGPKDGCGT